MRVLYLTQSHSLDFFYDLHKNSSSFQDAAYVVTDSNYYKSFIKKNPQFEKNNKHIFKDWELNPSKVTLDRNFLNRIESEYFDSPIINAAKIDRRLNGGLKSTYIQSYRNIFPDSELMKNIQLSFKEIHQFIEEFKPDLIIGFICVTLIEYIAFHIAKNKKIKYFNLRPTRIKNRFFVVKDIFDPPRDLTQDFELNILDSNSQKIAKSIIRELKKDFSYEGVIPVKEKNSLNEYFKYSNISSRFMGKENPLMQIKKYIINIFLRNYLTTVYYWQITKKYYAYSSFQYFKSLDKNIPKNYVIFPLHKEPEVQLLLHGSKYTNQIHFIRNVAKNLPKDITLIVKEHPMAVGYRPKSYYQKINNIPNVKVIGPMEDLSSILKNAKMLITIAGTSSFEAILRKIPVIHFGDLPFELINENMIKKMNNFEELSVGYDQLLNSYKYEESEVIRYIASCIRHSVPLDFYSLFLNKAKINIDSDKINYEKKKQLKNLENYIIKK